MKARHIRRKAILLLGPTGSGKSPLGDLLEREGLLDRKCHHFDFGAQLRRVASLRKPSKPFSAKDISLIRHVLRSRALLEDEQFFIAAKLLDSFLASRQAGNKDFIILNGLPRHAGQAEAIRGRIDVKLVVLLECKAPDVLTRIKENSGGDRTARSDDDIESVVNKLEIFRKRTLPLLRYYRSEGIEIAKVKIKADTQAADVRNCLNRR